MFEFKIKSPVGKFSKKHLQRYQAGGQHLHFISATVMLVTILQQSVGDRFSFINEYWIIVFNEILNLSPIFL